MTAEVEKVSGRTVPDDTFGAWIERGRVMSAESGGWTVASADRDGIVSPPLAGFGDSQYAVGDLVYFFLFRDGTGRILCKV